MVHLVQPPVVRRGSSSTPPLQDEGTGDRPDEDCNGDGDAGYITCGKN